MPCKSFFSSKFSDMFEDNSAALITIRSGYSTALRYLPKRQRLSLGALHEIFSRSDCFVHKIHTSQQRADALTKGLSKGDMVLARTQLLVAQSDAPVESIINMMSRPDDEANGVTCVDPEAEQ